VHREVADGRLAELVPDLDRAVLRARHDLEIALDGDLGGIHSEARQQIAHAHGAVQASRLAVDGHSQRHAFLVSVGFQPVNKTKASLKCFR